MVWIRTHKWMFLGVVSMVGLALDLWTKALAVAHLTPGRPVRVLGEVLSWNLVYNTKALFGLDPARVLPGGVSGPLFLGFSLLAVVVLVLFYARQREGDPVSISVGPALVLPGALGNLYDRIFFPRRGVVDFIQMDLGFAPANPWPIYNLADVFITVGVVFLLFAMFRDELTRRRHPPALATAPAATEGENGERQ